LRERWGRGVGGINANRWREAKIHVLSNYGRVWLSGKGGWIGRGKGRGGVGGKFGGCSTEGKTGNKTGIGTIRSKSDVLRDIKLRGDKPKTIPEG